MKEKCDSGNWSSSSCADRLTLADAAGRGEEGGDEVDDDVEQESTPFGVSVGTGVQDFWSTVFRSPWLRFWLNLCSRIYFST